MSAVLESVPASPVAAARERLEAVRRELAVLDARISECQRELDEREVERAQHRVATITAVSGNQPLPKALKLKASEAEVRLPILRGSRAAIQEREVEAVGNLRRAQVEATARYRASKLEAFAQASGVLIEAWRELVGATALQDQSGFKAEPLPHMLTADFAIPAMGKLRPIIENHWAHFVASHSIAQGELQRATAAARDEIEREIGMRLPW